MSSYDYFYEVFNGVNISFAVPSCDLCSSLRGISSLIQTRNRIAQHVVVMSVCRIPHMNKGPQMQGTLST